MVRTLLLVIATLLSAALPSRASLYYEYAFHFSNVSSAAGPIADFDFTFYSKAMIHSLSASKLAAAAWTPLSYSVNYFAENARGQFVFSQNAPRIGDGYVVFDSSTFAFGPNQLTYGYYDLGVYAGTLAGNDPDSFGGAGMLTVSEVSVPDGPVAPTPEPSTFVLVATGLLGLASRRASGRRGGLQ